MSTVVGNLARQFSADEVILAGDGPMAGQVTDSESCSAPTIFLRHPFNWRGENTLRKLSAPLLAFRTHRVCKVHHCKSILVVFPDEAYLFAGWLAAKMGRYSLYPYLHN
ncbi:MAG: hypothetical protein ACP5MD_10660, partial [Verrucomicrobiia bacterium]